MDFTRLRNYLFLSLLLASTFLLFYLFRPFAYPFFWSAVIAALFYPLYKGLKRLTHSPNFSSFITVILVIIIITIPLTTASALFISEAKGIYDSVNQGQIAAATKKLFDVARSQPFIANLNLDETMVAEKMNDAGTWLASYTFQVIRQFTENSVTFIVMFIIMIYTLFYFLRDGEGMLKKMMFLLPLGDKYEMTLYKKFTSATQAAIKGTLLIGLLQGTLGGILFALTGVPGAFIWGLIMVILSVIPAAGSFLIWVPAAIIMLLLGNVGSSVGILIGGLFISIIDNVIRPILIGNDIEMHPIIILFSTLGGIALFGISGFIIGPIIAALFQAFWEMYEDYYKKELDKN